MSPPRRPDPEPMETDDVRIVALGTVLWLIALVATLVFHDRLADQGNDDWVWIALAGVFLGFVGLRHVRRRRLTAATPPPATPPPTPPPATPPPATPPPAPPPAPPPPSPPSPK